MYFYKAITFILGLIIGLGSAQVFFVKDKEEKVLVEESECFVGKFISEHCHKPVIDKKQYVELKYKLLDYLEERKLKGELVDAGIYFRDLVDGPTLGINEYANYVPASLFKLPTLMSYYALSENDPGLLKSRLMVDERRQFDSYYFEQRYKPTERIVPGQEYSIEELIERMVVNSDNVALELLNNHLLEVSPGVDVLVETFKELGLLPDDTLNIEIPVKRYASIFRNLYYSSYLSPELSNRALDVMSKVRFDKGLEAGVPKDLTVSHKFGERRYEEAGREIFQLHDCGIVYYPDNPYLLCIMTKGVNFEELEKVIADISKMFYEEVDSRRFNRE